MHQRFNCLLLAATLTATAAAQSPVTSAPDPEESPNPRPSAEPLVAVPEPEPSWQQKEGWAWVIIGTSILAGSVLLAHGLSATCGDDQPCRVRSSLFTWGGIGVASTGALVGFTLLQERTPSPPAALGTRRSSPPTPQLQVTGRF